MKCHQCKKKFNKEQAIYLGCYYFCSKQHKLDHTRAVARKEKEKVKVRKEKKRDKKRNSVSYLSNIADKLWSEAVKIEYNYECQVEGCDKKDYLNSHHLYTRARKSTRWDISNGICLCSGHHTLNSSFSAHKTPLEFFEWLEGIRGRGWIDELSERSRKVVKVKPELIQERINELNNFITKYK